MAKFVSGHLDHAGFIAIKDELTAKLAAAFEKKLHEMGEDAKGITWFSSIAHAYTEERNRKAA